MTPGEKQQLKALFVANAAYYGHELPDDALGLYVADLEDLEFAMVVAAMKELRRDPKTRRCPLPADIRSRVEPGQDPESAAVMVANEILEAIRRVGPYHTPNLSDVANEVVRLEGGWQRLCEVVTNDNMTIFKAQWRELAKAVQRGERVIREALPAPSRGLTALGVSLPTLPPEESL